MRRTPLHLLVLPVAFLALTQTAGAQSQSRDNLTGVWALTNARIETVTKGTIERGTIVIRDGVIEAVGATVTIPADARVVDLSGKTIAPAFIDLTSSIGLRAPAQQGGGRGAAAAPAPIPGFPGAEPDIQTEERIRGLEPDRVVAEELNLSPADARTERDQGIGAVLVSPNRGLFRGMSALLPMRDDTAARWIMKSPVALHVGYQTVPNDYPSNLLGVIAYQRQAFYDAQRHAMLMDRYKANPRGMPRTAHNAELEALVPVVKGDIPVFIAANNENEMLRAHRAWERVQPEDDARGRGRGLPRDLRAEDGAAADRHGGLPAAGADDRLAVPVRGAERSGRQLVALDHRHARGRG